jgi:putative ABC transport system ATP-binding protein
VLEALDTVHHQLGTTVVLITHNASIATMANRVVTLADGRISDDRRNVTHVAPREIRW